VLTVVMIASPSATVGEERAERVADRAARSTGTGRAFDGAGPRGTGHGPRFPFLGTGDRLRSHTTAPVRTLELLRRYHPSTRIDAPPGGFAVPICTRRSTAPLDFSPIHAWRTREASDDGP